MKIKITFPKIKMGIKSLVISILTSTTLLAQPVTTVTGNPTYTIALSTSTTTPANIKGAAHYLVTNSGTNYLNHAIQTALNAGYKKIYIEEGEYQVTASINIYNSNNRNLLSGITIEGSGANTIIKPAQNVTINHIFNFGVFQLASPLLFTNTYCENNILRNITLNLNSSTKTGIRIGGRGQFNIIENIWIVNAMPADTETYTARYVSSKEIVDNTIVNRETSITATVAKGPGAIYIDLPIFMSSGGQIQPIVPITSSNPDGLALEADYNKFNNIVIRNCNIGISFNFNLHPTNSNIFSVFNANTFTNFTIDKFKTGIDFGPIAARCDQNLFDTFTMQPDKVINQFVFRRVHGSKNIIANINTFDWAATSPSIFMFEISNTSKDLTIENSNLRATGNNINNTSYIRDQGTGTKLINNNDVNGYTNNILRGVKDFTVFGQNFHVPSENDFQATNFNTIDFDDTRNYIGARFGAISGYTNRFWVRNKNIVVGQMNLNGTANELNNISSIELYGKLKWQPDVNFGTPEGPNKYVLSNSDTSCGVQWTKVSDLLSNSTWNHIAARNINMNGLAITNANNTATTATNTANTTPGIRLDSEGNVRIGTAAPTTYNGYNNKPKLKIDGDIEVNQGIFTTNGLPDGSTFTDGGERNDKCVVLSAGSIIGNGSGYNKTRMLNYYDFPASNLNPKSISFFGIEDRNDMGRYRMIAETNGYTELGMLNKNQQHIFKILEDGSDNINLTLPKPNSAVAIGTSSFSFPTDVTSANDGNYKLVVNGKIRGTGLKLTTSYWSDFVFAKGYQLPTLQEVEKHINEKGHLPNIPSEKEVLEKGVDMLEMATLQMQKIEELTLYIIEQNKKIEQLEQKINSIQTQKK